MAAQKRPAHVFGPVSHTERAGTRGRVLDMEVAGTRTRIDRKRTHRVDVRLGSCRNYPVSTALHISGLSGALHVSQGAPVLSEWPWRATRRAFSSAASLQPSRALLLVRQPRPPSFLRPSPDEGEPSWSVEDLAQERGTRRGRRVNALDCTDLVTAPPAASSLRERRCAKVRYLGGPLDRPPGDLTHRNRSD